MKSTDFRDEGVIEDSFHHFEDFAKDTNDSSKPSLISLFTTPNDKLDSFIEELVSHSLSKTFISTGKSIGGKEDIPLETDIPNDGSIQDYMDELSRVIPEATLVANPRQIGHMTSLLPKHTEAVSRMVTRLNQNMVKVETSAGLTDLETSLMRELAKEWGMEEGVVCSGGTIANLTALWVARGNNPNPGGIVLGSELLHYSFEKSCAILNLKLIKIPCVNFRISIPELTSTINTLLSTGNHITAIVGIAGTTETGSYDDILSLCKLGNKHSIHVHIDGAWGGPIIFSRYKHLLEGIHLANSITVDGHKQLYTPMGCGMVFLRGGSDKIRMEAEYIIRRGSKDLGRVGVEGSRPAVILYVHANLKIIGKAGLGTLIEMGCMRVREMYNRLRMFPGGVFECIHEPMSNILLYRYIPVKYRGKQGDDGVIDWVNERIQEVSKTSVDVDMIFTSRTRVSFKGKKIVCLRVVISNPLTTFDIIEKGIRAQLRVARRVERELEVKDLNLKWKGVLPVGFPWDL